MPNCIIVGSGPGLGESIARLFGQKGYKIGLISRSESKLEEQVDRLTRDGIHVAYSTADAGNLAELKKAMEVLINSQGPCDVLIYNAAVMKTGRPLELSSQQIIKEFEINVLGAHLSARLVAPNMIDQGQGAILFTGGGLALEPYPEWSSLALGKAALKSLSLSLFKELKPKGVHVAVLAICGVIAKDSPFDPNIIAEEYWRVATAPEGIEDREIIFQPVGTDPFYNDPKRLHRQTTLPPAHVGKIAET